MASRCAVAKAGGPGAIRARSGSSARPAREFNHFEDFNQGEGLVALKSFIKNVTTGGTAERVNSTDLLVRWAQVRAKAGNVGNVFVGDATVSSSDPALAAGDSLILRGDPFINLFDIFVDAATDGEGIDVWYISYQ